MKKAFLLSAAAAVSLITFGGIQQASAKELSCQHVVTVKKGNTVQHLTLQEAVEKLHMKTSVKQLNVKNEKELTQLLQKHAKHSDMTVKDVQKETPAKTARQLPKNRKPIKTRRLTMQSRQITQTTAARKLLHQSVRMKRKSLN